MRVYLFTVSNFKQGPWTEALLLLAALVLMPMTWCLARDFDDHGWAARLWKFDLHLQLPAALLLIPAFLLPQGLGAMLCALPWFIMLAVMAVDGLLRIRRHGIKPAGVFCRDVGLIFASVGGAWLLVDRFGGQPLGFAPERVLLAAVHFHYAGLILPVLGGLALNRRPDCPIARGSMWLVLLGVPLVAMGITISQVSGSTWTETLAAWVLALGGAGVALQHIVLAVTEPKVDTIVRGMWGVAGLALLVGMACAGLYAAREWLTVPWIELSWMRVLHSSLIAIGFSLLALLAWCRAGRQCCCGG